MTDVAAKSGRTRLVDLPHHAVAVRARQHRLAVEMIHILHLLAPRRQVWPSKSRGFTHSADIGEGSILRVLHDGDAAVLDRGLQEQVCGTFHYVLRLQPGGGRRQENRRTARHRCPRFLEWKRCAHLVRAGRSGDWNREIRRRRQRVIEHALPGAFAATSSRRASSAPSKCRWHPRRNGYSLYIFLAPYVVNRTDFSSQLCII